LTIFAINFVPFPAISRLGAAAVCYSVALKRLQPVAPKGHPGDRTENAIRENVRDMMNRLKNDSPVLTEFLKTGKIEIVGTRYDLDTGRVELLD